MNLHCQIHCLTYPCLVIWCLQLTEEMVDIVNKPLESRYHSNIQRLGAAFFGITFSISVTCVVAHEQNLLLVMMVTFTTILKQQATE